jgi:ubiquinone/menaquinone biosynthesis C-methylase UbiE
MHLLIRRPVAVLLFAVLLALLTLRGIIPSLSNVNTDFPNYLTSAKIVADGGSVERLYDTLWFQDQMRRYRIGRPSEGSFAPFPPPTALLLVPLASLAPLDAMRVTTCVNILCLAASILVLMRILSWGLLETAVFVLLSGFGLVNDLLFGQPYILISLSCIVGYYAYLERKPFLAGICFGLFAPIKYFPVVFLGYFAFRRAWRVVLGGTAAMLCVGLLSIGILGWKIHQAFFAVLANHLVAKLDLQDPFAVSYQSLDSLLRRLFVFDAVRNPWPLWNVPRLHVFGVLATKLALLGVAAAALVRLVRRNPEAATAPSIGILGILTMLLAPATASYHFLLLWLPVGLLVRFYFDERAFVHGSVTLGAYALINFFPYPFTERFAGHGGLSVLAYPRLFLLLGMFAAGVHFVWRRRAPAAAETQVQLRDTQEAFDSVAADYDGPRGNNSLIQDMRGEMWRWLDRTFAPGSRLIDLGCGTGLDAVRMAHQGCRVTATDWSPQMIARTADRARQESVAGPVEALLVGAHELERLEGEGTYEGAYSNLGPLNCVPDLAHVSAECARLLKPGGALVFTVIGRVCPWEIVHYARQARWPRLKLRFAPNVVPVGMNKRTIWTRYYTPLEFYGGFEREFALERYRGMCIFAPPPYLTWMRDRHPRLYEWLWRMDRRLAGWPMLRSIGDHFLIIMRKR